ncbi:TPA: hypothetical protein ACFOYC_002116, partial [Neisseria meningitidis]
LCLGRVGGGYDLSFGIRNIIIFFVKGIYTEDDSKPAGKKRPLLNCTPKVGHLTDFRGCSFLWQNIQMNSDLPSFNTIWQGTADHLSISDSLVRRWVTKYRLHGESGIKRRKHTTKYSVEYKLEAIRLVTG